MPEQLESLEQVVNFILQLDSAALQRHQAAMAEAVKQNLEIVVKVQGQVKDTVAKSYDEQDRVIKKSLKQVEDYVKANADMQLQIFENLITRQKMALDDLQKRKLAVVMDGKEREAIDQEVRKKLAAMAVIEQAQSAHLKKLADNASKKIRGELGISEPDEKEKKTGIAGLGGLGSLLAGGGGGGPGGALTGAAGGLVSSVASFTGMFGLMIGLLKGIKDVATEAYKADLQRAADQLRVMGGTLALAQYSKDPKAALYAKDIEGIIQNSGLFTKEERGQVPAAEAAMARGLPNKFDTANEAQLKEAFERLAAVSDQLGMDLVETGKTAADLARKEGFKNIGQAFTELERLGYVGQQLARDLNGIDITKFVQNTLSMQDQMRGLGYSIDTTTAVTKTFAKELDNGILTLSQLKDIVTGGAGQKQLGTEMFMAQRLMSGTDKESDSLRRMLGAVAPEAIGEALHLAGQGKLSMSFFQKLPGFGGTEKDAQVAQESIGRFYRTEGLRLAEQVAGSKGQGDSASATAYLSMIRRQLGIELDPNSQLPADIRAKADKARFGLEGTGVDAAGDADIASQRSQSQKMRRDRVGFMDKVEMNANEVIIRATRMVQDPGTDNARKALEAIQSMFDKVGAGGGAFDSAIAAFKGVPDVKLSDIKNLSPEELSHIIRHEFDVNVKADATTAAKLKPAIERAITEDRQKSLTETAADQRHEKRVRNAK